VSCFRVTWVGVRKRWVRGESHLPRKLGGCFIEPPKCSTVPWLPIEPKMATFDRLVDLPGKLLQLIYRASLLFS
jgi:hypothetical protein